MQAPAAGPLVQFGNRVAEYLPVLAGGVVVLGVGVLVSWVVKLAVIRALTWVRLDRLGGRGGWRAAFGKADVRSALYNIVGGTAMVLVFLVFLENALAIWGLTVLARLVEALLVYLPNLGMVALIVAVGVLLSNTLANRVEEALEEEGISHPRLLSKIFKGTLLAVVGALALWQLDFARQIVLAAFLISFGAIGVAFAMAVGLGSAKAIQAAWEGMFGKTKDR
jgi:Mechanosensitive ion channel, conserved TM helix